MKKNIFIIVLLVITSFFYIYASIKTNETNKAVEQAMEAQIEAERAIQEARTAEALARQQNEQASAEAQLHYQRAEELAAQLAECQGK